MQRQPVIAGASLSFKVPCDGLMNQRIRKMTMADRLRTMRSIPIAFAVALILSGAACHTPSSPTVAKTQDIGPSLDDCLARNRGRPVLIAFIWKWSPTGVGPRHALETPEAIDAMREHDVIPVIADLTDRRDLFPTLRVFDRLSPPFIVLYSSDRKRKPFVSEYSPFFTRRNGQTVIDGAAVARIIREYL